MFRSLGFAFGGLLLLACATLGFQSAGEYAQVFRNRGVAAVQDAIPLDVEIERLQLLLKKVDREASHSNHQVAMAQVALEDAKLSSSASHAAVEECKSNLQRLRNLSASNGGMIEIGCQKVGYQAVRDAMAKQVNLYRAKSTAFEAQSRTIASLEMACKKLLTHQAEWIAKRDTLQVTIGAMRARQTALAASAGSAEAIDSEQLVRAQELADSIERRLRIAEREQALGVSAAQLPAKDGESAKLQEVESDVDAIIGAHRAVAKD